MAPKAALVALQNTGASELSTPAKRRRMTEKKAEKCFDGLVQDQHAHDLKDTLQQISDHLSKFPEDQVLFRSVMRKRGQRGMAPCLRRGVACLDDVPDYIIQENLAAMSELDEGTFANFSPETRTCLFLWALAASGQEV